eukprot:Nk52_evm35s1671 gene=Nk52_evmTU35s1671
MPSKSQPSLKKHEVIRVKDTIKSAADSQSCGESQELQDEIEYLLDGFEGSQPVNVRCLSVFQFAERCLNAKFRSHLRANQLIVKISDLLKDAHEDAALSLCTITLVNIICQDKRNSRIEETTVGVVCDILHSEVIGRMTNPSAKSVKSAELMLKKVNALMAKNFKISSEEFKGMQWSTKTLTAECLSTLSSYHEECSWIKDEIRMRGAFDDIVSDTENEINALLRLSQNKKGFSLPESAKANLFLLEKCFKILENCTYENIMNQCQLLEYKDGLLLRNMVKVFELCENISADSVQTGRLEHGLLDCLLSCLRVMVNVTNKNEKGCKLIGSFVGYLDATVNTVIRLPLLLPRGQRFDVIILGLGLLINLIENNEENRTKLAQTSVLDILRPIDGKAMKRVNEQELKEKRGSVSSTLLPVYLIDTYLSGKETGVDGSTNEEKETETNIVSAYVAIFLGCLVKDNNANQKAIYKYLPKGGFAELSSILKEFLLFKKMAGIDMKDEDKNSICEIIKLLNDCA